MPDNPFKLWEELKRRKVVRVIIGYAAASFVTLELINNITEPLRLPEWVPTLVIVLLAIGFLIAIVMSWIFDITPEGVQKTEAAKVIKGKLQPEPVKRKVKLSDIIIAALLIAVVILAYPKIFNKDKFKGIRNNDGKFLVAVMPFLNVSGDTILEGLELGLQIQIISRLADSEELEVLPFQSVDEVIEATIDRNYASITSSMSKDIATKLDAKLVINGSIQYSGKELKILAQLLESGKRGISKSFEINGVLEDNLFPITESLVKQIKDYLEIKVLEQDVDPETRYFARTANVEAYRYFSKGVETSSSDSEASLKFFELALEADSNFVGAELALIPSYLNEWKISDAKQFIAKLNMKIDNYEWADQLYIKYWENILDKNPKGAVKYSEDLLREVPMQRMLWYTMGLTYSTLHQDIKAITAYEKSLELDRKWGGGWEWMAVYTKLGASYHNTGQHAKERRIYKLGLKVFPNYFFILRQQSVCSLSRGREREANKYIEQIETIWNEQGFTEPQKLQAYGSIYWNANIIDKAEQHYLKALELSPNYYGVMSNLAAIYFEQDINLDQGMVLINKALEANPDNLIIIQTKGWGLYKEGKYEESLELLEKSWDMRPLYNHQHYLYIQEVKQALAKQKSEQ